MGWNLLKPRELLVISEADLDAALAHLRALPHRHSRPVTWDRQHLLGLIREAVGTKRRLNEYYSVAPGVFALLKPFGTDLAGHDEPDSRLQVWLLIRSVGTDPSRITEI